MSGNRFCKFLVKHKCFFISMIMSIISITLWILTEPLQDTGDDAFIAWELSRGVGSIAAFISPYLSLLLSALYFYIPNIAWWTWLAFAGGAILLWLGYYIIQKRYEGFFVYAASIIWFVIVGISIIYKINFTRTSTAYALAGGLLILMGAYDISKKKIKKIILYSSGFILVLIGAMIRFQAALLILPFMGIVFFCGQEIENIQQIKKCFCKAWIVSFMRSLIPLLSVTICIIFLYGFNEYYWNTHPEWKAFNTYNSTRSTIADYVEYYPTWDEAEDEYKALGLKSENDLDMLFGFVFVGDTDVFSLETLEGITELKNQSLDIVRRLYRMFEKVVNMLVEGKVLIWLGLFLVILRYYIGKKRYLPSLLCCLYSIAILFLFSFLGRMMLRVWEPTLMCCMGILLFYFTTDKHGAIRNCVEVSGISYKRKRTPLFTILIRDYVFIIGAICILAISTGVFDRISQFQFPSYATDRDKMMRERAEYINSTPEKIYLLSWPLIHHPPTPGFFGMWEPLPENYLKNCFALSNWDARTPYNLNMLETLDIKNPAEALITRTDTYSDYEERLYRFFKEHYNENITVSKVDSFKDGGAIVQYTVPIEENKIDTTLDPIKVNVKKSEYSMQNEKDTWYLKASLETDELYKEIYCNIVVKNNVYSFRLNNETPHQVEAYFYNINDSVVENIESCYLVGLSQNNEYVKLSDIEIR